MGTARSQRAERKRVARKFLYVVAALVVLVVVMILGFVKPRGTTPWAARPVS